MKNVPKDRSEARRDRNALEHGNEGGKKEKRADPKVYDEQNKIGRGEGDA